MSTSTEIIPQELNYLYQASLASRTLRLRGATAPSGSNLIAASSPTPNLVECLAPGDSLTTSLADFTSTYLGIGQAFDQLLSAAYLEQIKVDESGSDTAKGLRSFIVDLNGKFQVYASQEVSAARNLISLGEIIPVLLTDRSVGEYSHD